MQDQNTTEKRCTLCREMKSLDHFSINKKGDLGLDGRCRECKARIWREEHPPTPQEVLPEDHRRCTRCKEIKPLDGFGRDINAKGGIRGTCKACNNAMAKTYASNTAEANRARYAALAAALPAEATPPDLKECSCCRVTKPLVAFYQSVRYAKGVTGQCKECRRVYTSNLKERIKGEPKISPARKTCTSCDVEKPAASFSRMASKRDGLGSWCKECRRKREYNDIPREERDRRGKENYLWSLYRLRLADYLAMMAAQGGLCAICRGEMKRACVDHCHATGKVRGLLCLPCNNWIAGIEVPGFVEAARAYLERTK